MNIITITSNYGIKDPYLAILKGLLLTENQSLNIVDISHEIAPGNLAEAAYILESAYAYFPKGTVHLCAVEERDARCMKYIAMEKRGHFFVGPDNGILSMVAPKLAPDSIHEIEINPDSEDHPGMKILARAASFLANGGVMSVLGQSGTKIKQNSIWRPSFNKDLNLLSGIIIYIDRRGNLITNIEQGYFEELTYAKSFQIRLPTQEKITRITTSLDKKPPQSTTFACFNLNGLLEICISEGSSLDKTGASDLLGLGFRDTIDIEIK
jgi:S-adenosylmethionine hydrolase